MPKYVKGPGSDTWHWCTNCSRYPSTVADVSYSKPSSGELCNECKAKDRDGDCSS